MKLKQIEDAVKALDREMEPLTKALDAMVKKRSGLIKEYWLNKLGIEPGITVVQLKDGTQYLATKLYFSGGWNMQSQPWLLGKKRTKTGWHSKEFQLYRDWEKVSK